MSLFIDASVALKWVLEEPDTPVALDLVDEGPLILTEFMLLECANVLTQQVRSKQIPPGDAMDRLDFVQRSISRPAPVPPYLKEAQRLSLRFEHSAYDCLYLATAIAVGAVLVTADRRLAEIGGAHFPTAVRLLAD